METVLEKTKNTAEKIGSIAPQKDLIYEEIDGIPFYYRGWREVLNQQKSTEEIMGCSDTQGILISLLLDFLYKNLPSNYRLLTNEIGLHLAPNNNLASDIVIYQKSDLKGYLLQNQYLTIPPRVVIEVDIHAETEANSSNQSYVHRKIDKLLDFGVEQVLWFFSNPQKVIVAESKTTWQILDWYQPIFLLGKYQFSLVDLIREDGLWVDELLKIKH